MKLEWLTLALFWSSAVYSQTAASATWGINPNLEYDHSSIDSVSYDNGNLILHIPVISVPQAGDLPPFSLMLVYNSNNWSSASYPICPSGDPNCNQTGSYYTYVFSGGGVSLVRDNYLRLNNSSTSIENIGSINTWFILDPTGGHHVIHPIRGSSTWASVDGSAYLVNYSGTNVITTTITDRNGIQYISAPGVDVVKDRYGNTISGASTQSGYAWTDSLGHQIQGLAQGPIPEGGLIPTGGTSCPVLSLPSATGVSQYTICWEQLNIGTSFNQPGIREGAASIYTIQSVSSPSGQYSFEYDSWGSLHRINLPRGGSITYNWTTVINGTPENWTRTISSRIVNDNAGHTSTWTYGYTPNASSWRLTYPNQDYRIIQPIGINMSYQFVSSVSDYKSDGTLVKTASKVYDVTGGPTDWTAGLNESSQFVTSEITAYPGGKTSQVCDIYDGNTADSCQGNASISNNQSVFTYYDENESTLYPGQPTTYYPVRLNSLTQRDEFDFGSGSAGGLLRKTNYQYKWQTTPDYLSANLLDTPTSVVIKDGSGSQVASTTTLYDEINGVSQGIFGKPTTIQKWLNSPSKTITSYLRYNAQGKVSQVIDPLLRSTTTTSFQCSNNYPYEVLNALSQVTRYTYNCNTGLVTAIQTPNDIAASRNGHGYSYDSMNNLIGETFADGGSISYDYGGYANPLVVTTTVHNGSSNIVSSTTYDGLGRPVRTSFPNGATSETVYDLNGRVQSVSTPHFSTPSMTDGFTTYSYDVLNRKLMQCHPDNGTGSGPCVAGSSYLQWEYNGNITTAYDERRNSWQRTADGLGRLTKVLEPGSLTTQYSYDALGNLLKVNQQGNSSSGETARIRSFSYDSLSRLVCSSNPENSTTQCPTASPSSYVIGTTGYTYDDVGNLKSKQSPAVNLPSGNQTISYCYDVLNRLTIKSLATSNDCSGGQVIATYAYDSSGVSGAQNTIGRLTEESSYAGSTLVSKRQPYSYDPVGRLLDEKQFTLANLSGAAFSASNRYDLAGNVVASTDGARPIQAFNQQFPCVLPANVQATVNSWTTLAFINCYDSSTGRISSMTSNWGTYVTNLFTIGGTNGYGPAGQLRGWSQGPSLTLTQTYSNRLWTNSISAAGQIP